MKKSLLTFSLVLMFSISIMADDIWNLFYRNWDINPSILVQSEIRFAPDGTLYLAEFDLSEIYNTGETFVNVRSFDVGQWSGDILNQDGWAFVGAPILMNLPNNESWIDFAISNDNQLYIGMLDSIAWFNASSGQWEATHVPDYIGGMTVDESGNLLILLSVGSGSTHHFQIAVYENGAATPIANIEYELPGGIAFFPRIMNEANRIIQKNGDFYVSIARASTQQNYYFKGNVTDGFTMLKEHFNHLNLSSMVVSEAGEIIISHRGEMSPYTLAMKTYDFDLNDWVAFDTTGLNAGAAHRNFLAYDRQGRLHFAYSGPSNKGFVYRYGPNGWEHLGPHNAVSIAQMPALAFDLNNRLYLLHGIGAGATPLIIRRYVDETTSVAELKKKNEMRVYPNPASGQAALSWENENNTDEIAVVSIYDSYGRLVRQQSLRSGSESLLQLQGLKPGIYQLVLRSKSSVMRSSLIVQ